MRRLEARAQNLETALRAAQEESKLVREAALTLAGVGQRMETAVEKAMGGKEGPS
jgi:exonuclease VII small subunit